MYTVANSGTYAVIMAVNITHIASFVLLGVMICLTVRGMVMQRHRSAVMKAIIQPATRMKQLCGEQAVRCCTSEGSIDRPEFSNRGFTQMLNHNNARSVNVSEMVSPKKLMFILLPNPCLVNIIILMILETIPNMPRILQIITQFTTSHILLSSYVMIGCSLC